MIHTVKRNKVIYYCDQCGQEMESPIGDAGQRDKCTKCGVGFVVPGAEEAEQQRAEAKQRRTQGADRRMVELAEAANTSAGPANNSSSEHHEQRRPVVAWAALLLSIIAIIIGIYAITQDPLGRGMSHYVFTTPFDAYKSSLAMSLNGDSRAQMEYQTAVNGRKLRERLETVEVKKTSEYEGKVLLFIEYKEAGLPKHSVIGMEKDAATGLWSDSYFSQYLMGDKNPKLAAEVKAWEDE